MGGKLVVLLVVALGACAANTHEVQIDLPQVFTTDLVVYRDGVGTWETPTVRADNTFTIEVTDDFQVVAALDAGSGEIITWELAATAGEGTHWIIDESDPYFAPECSSIPAFAMGGDWVAVTGSMLQAGQVSTQPWCESSTTQPWNFGLQSFPGSLDLIATDPFDSATHRVLIARGEVIDGPAVVPDLDLSAGISLVPIHVDVYKPDVATTTVEVILTTTAPYSAAIISMASGITTASTQTTSALVAPPMMLQPTDTQLLVFHAPGALGSDRAAQTIVSGQDVALELVPPPVVTYAPGDGDVATWGAPLAPRFTSVDFDLRGESQPWSWQHVTATKGWLDTHDATSLAFETDVPGYQPAWSVDHSHPYERQFSVTDDSTDITYWTTVTSDVSNAAARISEGRHSVRGPMPTATTRAASVIAP
jgi:hypothetical protein